MGSFVWGLSREFLGFVWEWPWGFLEGLFGFCLGMLRVSWTTMIGGCLGVGLVFLGFVEGRSGFVQGG